MFTGISGAIAQVKKLWMPPPRLTVSEWADKFRRLSPESSAEPGQWKTSRAPYLKKIMDAFNDPYVKSVVVMSSAQVGKTEIISNTLGYYAHQDPSPILVLQPTLAIADAYSKDRLSPMVRDSPELFRVMGEEKSKKSDNTILHKIFPGGHVTMAGSNSPASLASRPIRVLLCDEVDRYPASAGTEGDPINLAKKRTTTFWNRKLGLFSTPTIAETSRIERAFNDSDQNYYYVPCPHCTHYQVLTWQGIKWETLEEGDRKVWYECVSCNKPIAHTHKLKMLSAGEWRASKLFNGVRGFHIWEAYSPWKSWSEIVADFLEAKKSPDLLKTWVNTSLGQCWRDDTGDVLEWEKIAARAEEYDMCSVPAGGLLLTAGVDVQADRVAVVVRAWGRGEQSWLVYWGEIFGDTSQHKVWADLDNLLSLGFKHESGKELKVLVSAIDSGFRSTEVYTFVRANSRKSYHPIAIKGQGAWGKSILGRATLQDFNYKGQTIKRGVKLYSVGVSEAKQVIYSRLKLGMALS